MEVERVYNLKSHKPYRITDVIEDKVKSGVEQLVE